MKTERWYEMKAIQNAVSIDLMDEIGLWGITAADFKRELESLDDGGDILVSINSPGGSVFDGIAIYALLAERRERVKVQVYGLAASIASVIALAGDELVMRDGSMLMIHDPWSLTIGDAEEHRKTAELLDKISGQIMNIYRQHTAWTDDELEAAMREETWLSAQEAVDVGFADRVEGEKAAASVRYFAMMDKFKHPPVGRKENTQATEPDEEATMEQEKASVETKDAQAQVPETQTQQPQEPAASDVRAELTDRLEAFEKELREVKDGFANISLGTKTMPREPEARPEWLANALLKGAQRRGLPQDAAATISVGDGFGVPIPASEQFLINLNHYSILRRMGATVRGAGAQQTKFTTSINKHEAAIISEHGTYAEKAEPTPITMDLYKVGGRYSLSEETDEDTVFEEFEVFQLEAAVAIAKGENHYFLTGTDSGEPRGLDQETAAVTAAAHNAVTFDELVELDESLGTEWDLEMMWDGMNLDNYRGPIYIMHPDTAAAVRTVISNESAYVFTEDGMGRLMKLFNRPVIRDSHMALWGTDNITIALVNPAAYLIGERRPNLAIRVGQDNDSHDITWDFAERVGGETWDTNGLATLQMAATT